MNATVFPKAGLPAGAVALLRRCLKPTLLEGGDANVARVRVIREYMAADKDGCVFRTTSKGVEAISQAATVSP